MGSVLLLSGILFFGLAGFRGREDTARFVRRTVNLQGSSYPYQVFLPSGWSADRRWPVILFLHGAGERGEDGVLQTQVGLGPVLRSDPDRCPALVVMPQCRPGVWWTESSMEEQALAALEAAIQEFHGERRRVYLTGLSMGGYGAWSLAGRHPGVFAALAVICGGVVPPSRVLPPGQTVDRSRRVYQEAARRIGQTPVWVFHGSDDSVVPVSESRNMVEALQELGGRVRYTEYPGIGHNSWDRAYGEAELIPWLLSHHLEGEPGGP